MTQFECEMALLKLAEAAREIVKLHNPEINFTSITFSDAGYVCVDAAKFEGTKLVKGDLLNAVRFSDGDVCFGGTAEDVA